MSWFLERTTLIVSIFGLNFPFKVHFLENLGEKTPKCFPAASFSCVFWRNFYRSNVVPQSNSTTALRYTPASSIMFSVIKAYWDFIKVNSGLFRDSQPSVWPLHILNQLTRHIQKHRALFSHIQARTLCNACICRNLVYSESWNTQNSSIIASLHLESCQIYAFTNIQSSDILKTRHIFRTLAKI